MILQRGKKRIPFITYLLVFYLIIGSDTVLFGYTSNVAIKKAAQYFMVALSLLAFCYYLLQIRKRGINLRFEVFFLIIAIAWILVGAVMHDEFRGGTISIIALFILGYSICNSCNMKAFIKAYLNLITIIALFSLVCFAFSFAIVKLEFIPTITNSIDREFKCLLLSNVAVGNITRNYGPFTEPSRYQAYLNLALILLLFTNDKINYKRVCIILVTLGTTFSTTGYIAFIAIVIAFIFSRKVNMRLSMKILFSIPLVVVCVVLFNANEAFSSAIMKITMGDESISASTRIDSIKINLIIIKDNFLFGAGFSGSEQAFKEVIFEYGFNAQTNTITPLIYFSKFGVVVGLFYVYALYNLAINLSNSKCYVIIFIALLLLLSGISFLDSLFFNVMLFYRKPAKPLSNIRLENTEGIS